MLKQVWLKTGRWVKQFCGAVVIISVVVNRARFSAVFQRAGVQIQGLFWIL